MSYAAIVVGLGTVAYGAYSKGRANKKAKDALAKRKSYQTPDEVFQILNAVTNKSQGDTQTRDYNTGQLDRAFSNTLDTATLLGADPNDLSALFDQKMNGIIQVGQQFHASNMEAFGKYIGALDMVAQNKAAEFNSGQDIVKDSLQAAAADKAAANATINSGINTTLSGLSAAQSNKLYKEYLDSVKGGKTNTGSQYVDAVYHGPKGVEHTTVTDSSGRGGTWNPTTKQWEGNIVGTNPYTNPTGSVTAVPPPTGVSQAIYSTLPAAGTPQYNDFINWLNSNGKLGKI